MGKQPYIPLYIGDWEQDTNCLSLEAEGAWLKLVFKLWKGESNLGKGLLSISFRSMAVLFKCSPEKTKAIFQELVENRVFDHEILPNGDVKIKSRRLVREAELSKIRSGTGKLGGRPKLQKQTKTKDKPKQKQNPEYEYDNESENGLKFKKEPISKLDIFEAIFTDEIFIDQLSQTHKGKDFKAAFEECYTHHSNAPNPPREIWLWKQKLNTWLTIKGDDRSNGKSKFTTADRDKYFDSKYGTEGTAKA